VPLRTSLQLLVAQFATEKSFQLTFQLFFEHDSRIIIATISSLEHFIAHVSTSMHSCIIRIRSHILVDDSYLINISRPPIGGGLMNSGVIMSHCAAVSPRLPGTIVVRWSRPSPHHHQFQFAIFTIGSSFCMLVDIPHFNFLELQQFTILWLSSLRNPYNRRNLRINFHSDADSEGPKFNPPRG
jgi:hypothetical protein